MSQTPSAGAHAEAPTWLTPRRAWLLATALALAFFAQVLHGSLGESLTWDEPGYVASGYVNWTQGDYRLAPDHPPLMQKLQALPLLFMDLAVPPLSGLRWGVDPNPRVTYGRAFFFASGNDPIRMARWARLPVHLLGVLLVLVVHGFMRALAGAEAALLATLLVAFDPSLVAHARLATEDLGCAALVLCACLCLWRWLERPGPLAALICGAVSGLALLSKYTALLLAPMALLIAVIWWMLRGRRPIELAARGRDLLVMAAVAVLLVNFAYGLGFGLSRFVSGIGQIYPDVAEGYRFYFWGEVYERPLWYYALASIAIKTPLPVYGLLVLAGIALVRSGSGRIAAAVCLAGMAPVLISSCFDITAPGIRRVLIAVPFILMLAALAVTGRPGPVRRALAWGFALLSVVVAASIHPYQLSYMNLAFGGPDAGPTILDESNIDWGQDLPALARWQREHAPGEVVSLLYFGTADPIAYGVRAVPFDEREIEHPTPGLKAISAHFLAALRKAVALNGADADWLTKYEPIAKAGYSIFIYRFPESEGHDAQ